MVILRKFRELSSLDLNDYESERQKFLAEGGCPGQIRLAIYLSLFRFLYARVPPLNFPATVSKFEKKKLHEWRHIVGDLAKESRIESVSPFSAPD